MRSNSQCCGQNTQTERSWTK